MQQYFTAGRHGALATAQVDKAKVRLFDEPVNLRSGQLIDLAFRTAAPQAQATRFRVVRMQRVSTKVQNIIVLILEEVPQFLNGRIIADAYLAMFRRFQQVGESRDLAFGSRNGR